MLSIHLHSNGQVQLIDRNETPPSTRFVSLESFIDVFRGQENASPILPEGCVQYWRGTDYTIVALKRAAHKREMSIYSDESLYGSYTLPIPATLFVFRVSNPENKVMTIIESAIFTFFGDWKGVDTQLYSFPYGNIFDEQTICWGDFEGTIQSIEQLDSFIDVFLSTPFNDDLTPLFKQSDDIENSVSIFSFWEKMSLLPEVPEESLTPVCTYEEMPAYLTGELFF